MLENPRLWQLITHFFEARDWDRSYYTIVSERAGFDDWKVERIVDRQEAQASRGTLLKIAAAMGLDPSERKELEQVVVGYPRANLCETRAEPLVLDRVSMRRGVLLLTAPTDPHLLPLNSAQHEVATRTGVVFGWHDVVVRITTPESRSVLDYADELFGSNDLRTIETILLRDDLPTYIDQAFSVEGLDTGDYYWAVIFVQALGTPTKVEVRDLFSETASEPDLQGGIHLLTAAVVVGRFDTVVEVLAANLLKLQAYVRSAQKRCSDDGQEVHTVTYFALQWDQMPSIASF